MVENKTAIRKPEEIKRQPPPAPKPADPLKILLQKKISYLRRKIIIGLCSFGGLLVLTGIIFLYFSDLRKTSEAQLKQINNYLSSVTNKSNDIKLKMADAKKYKEIWKQTKENKRSFDGANINDINKKFADLSDKHHITKSTIKISVPETLKGGVYDRSTVDISVSSVEISFGALTDVKAMSFINEFIENLPGYVITTDLTMRRIESATLSNADLISISTGNFIANVDVKLEFSWYILKKKIGGTK